VLPVETFDMAARSGVHENRSTARSLLPGAVAGAVAFVAGYAATFLLKSAELSNLPLGPAQDALGSGVAPPADWQVIGWFFYQMHNVGTTVSVAAVGQSQSTATTGNVATWMLFVPIVALVVSGFLVGRYAGVEGGRTAALAGASVGTGYGALAVAFALLTNWSASATAFGQSVTLSIGPSLLPAVLLAGLLYPIAFGALGGALAGAVPE
jgi:hypothetical protein